MSRQEVQAVQQTLTAMYRDHELSPEDYAAAMEDTRLVAVTS